MIDNLLLPLNNILGSLRHRDQSVNLLLTLCGLGDRPFFVDAKAARSAGWSRQRIAAVLGKRGIPTWGFGQAMGQMYFRVPLRRAKHAAAILRAAGVPVVR